MCKICKKIVCLVALALVLGLAVPAGAAVDTMTVSGTPWGVSTVYIGACEGSARFNINDIVDLGINNYRIWGGMSRWEYEDDDGVYGSPTIAEIKANPDVINWAWWDNAMTNPPCGSDYHWSDCPPLACTVNARTIFQQLKDNNVKVVLTVRNYEEHGPAWAAELNPPNTPEDWNEWWEHVFATVYWLNVRNDYRVDDFQVHNEPDNPPQGWGGTQEEYFLFVQYTNDAIQYVYSTYLPGRTPQVYAPVSQGRSWVADTLINVPDDFDIVDFHTYGATGDWSGHVQEVHGYINQYGGGRDYPVFVSEWGTWHQNKYDTERFTVNCIIKNTINGSRPGNDYVYGHQIFCLYDWADWGSGLIHGGETNPSYMPGYYGMRLAIRGVQGGRTTYETTSSNSSLQCITTEDGAGNISLVVNNPGRATTVDADLSALITSGTGTMWQFGDGIMDEVVGSPTLNNGHVVFDVPSLGAILIQFGGAPPDTDPPTPDPMTWQTVPYATGTTSIAMVATTATDASGVEYYFSCISSGGHDSSWQDGTSYEDTGLQPATQYCYTVKARDKSSNLNQTAESTVECATTEAAGAEIYVYDIAMSSYESKANYYVATATMWIKDVSLNDISDATVTGEWSGATTKGDIEGITGADGKVTLESKAVKGGGTFTFCVTDVSATGYTYNSSLNNETCDSITGP